MRKIGKCLIGIILTLAAAQAGADTINIDVGTTTGDNRRFVTQSAVPGQGTNSATIHVGDTVVWTWRGGFHNIRENNGSFQSTSTGQAGFTYSQTFNTPGTVRYYCTFHGSTSGAGMAGTLIVQTRVSGTVSLEDCFNPVVPLTFTFHPTDNSGDVVKTVTPDASGAFTVSSLLAKSYTLRVKGNRWLAVQVPVNTTGGNVTALALGTLKSGDANNDNSVDVLDLDTLITTFDKCNGDQGYIEGADLNCDNCVDVLDLDLLIRNFDQTGA